MAGIAHASAEMWEKAHRIWSVEVGEAAEITGEAQARVDLIEARAQQRATRVSEDAQARADDVVRRARAEAARIVEEARLAAPPTPPAPVETPAETRVVEPAPAVDLDPADELDRLLETDPIEALSRVAEELRGSIARLQSETTQARSLLERFRTLVHLSPEARRVLAATSVLVGTAVSALSLIVFQGGPLAVIAAVVVALVLPGAGVVAAIESAGPQRAATALLISMTWTTTVALVSAWTTWQSAIAQFTASVAPGVIGATIALNRADQARLRARELLALMPWRHRAVRISAALLTGSLLACAVAIVMAIGKPIGDYGLLPLLGPAFIVAVVLAVASVIVGLIVRPVVLSAVIPGVITLIGLFTLPMQAFTDNLTAGWAYKHLGVVDLIVQQTPLSDPKDLFQQWPGFFAAAAQLQVLSGMPPLRYADYAQPLFVALSAFAVFMAARLLIQGKVGPVVATLFFVCSMWAGQFYYAPQSMCYSIVLLCLVQMIALVLSQPQQKLYAGWWGKLFGWTIRGLPEQRPLDRATQVTLVVTISAAFAIVTVSHQMSPYMMLLQIGPLFVIGWFRGWWKLWGAAMALGPIAWLILNRSVMGGDSALNGFSFGNATSMVTGPSSAAQHLAAKGARFVLMLIMGGGFLVALLRIKRLGSVALIVCFAVMPVFILGAGSYGGEAVYRVWLFAAPWFCILLGMGVASIQRRRVATLIITGVVACAMFVASSQATLFGMFPFVKVDDAQIAASRWLAEKTPPGSSIIDLTGSFPDRVTAGYADRNPRHTVNNPAILSYPDFTAKKLAVMTPAEMSAAFRKQFLFDKGKQVATRLFVVISRSMIPEVRYYGLMPEGGVLDLVAELGASSSWRLAFNNSDVWVFEAL